MNKRRMRQCRLEGGCEGRRRRKSDRDSDSCTVNLHGGLVMLEVLSPVEDPALSVSLTSVFFADRGYYLYVRLWFVVECQIRDQLDAGTSWTSEKS